MKVAADNRQSSNLCQSEIFTPPAGKLGKPTSSAPGGQRKGGGQEKLISVCGELRHKVIECYIRKKK